MLFFLFFTVSGYPSEPFTPFSMPPSDDIIPEEFPTDGTTTTITTTTTTNGDSKERIYNGLNDKLIPIYCSILAAVVVGLVAFIIFKRWGGYGQGLSLGRITVLQTEPTEKSKVFLFFFFVQADKMNVHTSIFHDFICCFSVVNLLGHNLAGSKCQAHTAKSC